MSEVISWPPPYTVKRYRLARHVKLRASRSDGLIISTPQRFSLKHIPKILEEHRAWIVARLQELQAQKTDELPTSIALNAINQCWKISYLNGEGRLKLHERTQLHELVISGNCEDSNKCRAILLAWLRKKAAEFLSDELVKVSQQCHLPFSSLRIRDQKTMWGSCTAAAAISLNYKLIFLPYPLARHIMIHELCHTKHHNHSLKFWQLVAAHDDNWRHHKRELKQAEKLMPGWLS